MTLQDQIRSNPMTWKDALNVVGGLLTIAVVLVQGGKVLEKLDTISEVQKRHSEDIAKARVDITILQGADALHNEQIANLKSRIDTTGGRVK